MHHNERRRKERKGSNREVDRTHKSKVVGRNDIILVHLGVGLEDEHGAPVLDGEPVAAVRQLPLVVTELLHVLDLDVHSPQCLQGASASAGGSEQSKSAVLHTCSGGMVLSRLTAESNAS